MPLAVYAILYLVPIEVAAALILGGFWTLLPPLTVFGVIPLLGTVLRGRPDHLTTDGELGRPGLASNLLVRAALPVQLGIVGLLLHRAPALAAQPWVLLLAIASAGICCGALAINIAHELGHRVAPLDRWIARSMLVTSLYAHFFVEHNRGHHVRVATPEDPASARRGELLYGFLLRSVVGGFRSAWHLEQERLQRLGRSPWSLRNEVLLGVIVELSLVALALAALGPVATGAWLGAAALGVLLLETVNYVEHYGLQRNPTARGFEPVRPIHSWNADHPADRIFLLELTRHSDHHAHPRRPFPLLRNWPDAPQLPAGYATMVLVALIPPLFFAVMDPRLDRLQGRGTLSTAATA